MSAQDLDGESDTEAGESGEMPRPHMIRLELVDELGQLLATFKPIPDNGGNPLSISHEHGSLTLRGYIPVEVDLECPPNRFARIVEALRDAGVNVIRAGMGHFGEEVMVTLVGDIADSDPSDMPHRIESPANATPQDLSLLARGETDEAPSAWLRLVVRSGRVDETFGIIRDIAVEKELRVVESLVEGSQ